MQQGFNHQDVFVPFPGDFFSIITKKLAAADIGVFSSPFSGTFFSINDSKTSFKELERKVFVPFLGDLFFNSMPAKPQPVCSRKRIRGGDGEIASSGTLLRR